MRPLETIAAVLLSLGIGVAGGCAWEKLDSRIARAAISAQLDIANGNVDACAATLKAVQRESREEIDKADKRAAAVHQAVEDLAREALHMGEALGQAELEIARLRESDPDCREQLEQEICAAVPLL